MLNLLARIGLDTSGFELGIKRAQSTAKKFSGDLGKEAGGRLKQFLTLAAAEEGIRRLYNYASHVADLSDQLGISTTALQQWEGAANSAGAKADDVAKFFEQLAISRDKALSGDANSLDAFHKLGVSSSDLSTMRLEDLGLKIGNAVKDGDAQKLISSLREIGGKGAAGLVATFKSGLEEGFKNTSIIPPEQIAEFDRLGDRFTSLGKSIMAFFAPIALWIGRQIDNITTLAQYMMKVFSATGSAILHGRAVSEEDRKEADKIISDWEDRRKPKPGDAPDAGGGGTPKIKQGQLVPDTHPDFFNYKNQQAPGYNLTENQKAGAYIAIPLQNDMRDLAKEVRAAGLTLREYLNYARSVGKRPPGFDGSSSDAGAQGRGVQF